MHSVLPRPVGPALQREDRTAIRLQNARVRLVAFTRDPFRLAVASARTCYAADFVVVGALDRKGRDRRTTLLEALPSHAGALERIGNLDTPHDERVRLVEELQQQIPEDSLRSHVAAFADLARQRAEADAGIAHSIYEAGHHTPFQHPTFVFSLEGVSRNAVESFFHNHTFYNSEQQSQRYVEMKEADVVLPASILADAQSRALAESAIQNAWNTYHDLRDRLVEANLRTMQAIGKIKGQSEKAIRKDAEKKAQEMARYVIPIAAATQLYHTVSGIVLLRYIRMCQAGDAPDEVAAIVEAMAREVAGIDPGFLEQIQEQPRARADHVERRLASRPTRPKEVLHLSSGPHVELVAATQDGTALVQRALAEVTGSTDLERLLDPKENPALSDTLNTWDHSPALRTLRHVHYTFRKRLSLTAYAQDQRHRLTPGSRPLLSRLVGAEPDVYVPDIVERDAEAHKRYAQAVLGLYRAMWDLLDRGHHEHDVAYLLPNAANVHFTQSGDLLSFMHKWRLRLCFNAQKEIFEAALAELRLAQDIQPDLTRFMGPPCSFVAARVPAEKQDDVGACCPEGPRWCGVKVWKNFDPAKGTPRRPF